MVNAHTLLRKPLDTTNKYQVLVNTVFAIYRYSMINTASESIEWMISLKRSN